MSTVLKIPANSYIHLADRNSGITKLLLGPLQYTTAFHEAVVQGPNPLVVVPPQCFITVADPVARDDRGNVLVDQHGAAVLRLGREEVRLNVDPFPLYPGETLKCQPTAIPHIDVNEALLLRARLDCSDRSGTRRRTGDLWLFLGPALYQPMAEIEIVEKRSAIIVGPNEALHVRAIHDCVDWKDKRRKAGEHWLIRDLGAYMLQVPEQEVALCQAYVLTSNDALIVRANVSFTTHDGKVRTAGEEYLITSADFATFIPDVHETVVAQEPIVSLSRRQYCIVENPVDPATGLPRLGQSELRRGELTFFLKPGESLYRGGVFNVIVLGAHEALAVRCWLPFDDNGVARKPGELIMVNGPGEYVPRVEVKVEKLLRAKLSFLAFNLHLFFAPVYPMSILDPTPVNVAPRAAPSNVRSRAAAPRGRK